jgi:pSer/pThr/pTyr-binding forkhead associated (FHA) protein
LSKECSLCGEDNIDSATECENCGGKSFSTETSANLKEEPAPTSVLTMTDRKSDKVIIISNSCLIGREGDVEAEFFAEDMHISRRHCNVILEKGEYKIEHLSKVTPTKINNIELSRGIRKTIRNGDYLTIADKTFEISICNDAIQKETIQDTATPVYNDSINTDSVNKTKYIIVCPKCGSEYEVDNIDERISECSNCDDYDKREISKIGAKIKYAN